MAICADRPPRRLISLGCGRVAAALEVKGALHGDGAPSLSSMSPQERLMAAFNGRLTFRSPPPDEKMFVM